MIDQDKVRSVVARFFNVSEATVTESFVFPPERLHGSVGRATFYAAIKRMAGADLPIALTATTFGELFHQTPLPADGGKSTNSAPSVPPPPALVGTPAAHNFSVGIDIEHFENLPAASDPWTEPFYLENFTPPEIAYCQRQPNPRESFCGLWCAKEAVMKSCLEFFNRRPLELEITHDTQGRPFLTMLRDGKPATRSGCDLSISHSHGVSVAVFVTGVIGSPVASSESLPAARQKPGSSGGNSLAWLALGLSGLSLLLWLLLAIKK
jgi:phosphopantetheine--protein transferase-like protein